MMVCTMDVVLLFQLDASRYTYLANAYKHEFTCLAGQMVLRWQIKSLRALITHVRMIP